jgi:hypothetical protein
MTMVLSDPTARPPWPLQARNGRLPRLAFCLNSSLGFTGRKLRRDVICSSEGAKTADSGYCGQVTLEGLAVTNIR